MDYREFPDGELLSLVCESSEEAKEILYEKYKYIIDVIIKKYLLAAKKLGIEYNDFYQEGLVGFADALNCYDERKNTQLATFISLCIERRLQNAVLKAGRLKNKMQLDSLSLDRDYGEHHIPLVDMIVDDGSDPLLGITKKEEYEHLLLLIKTALSTHEYEVYSLLLNGLSYQEIALVLNKTPKQIDNTIQRLRNKIKKIINEVE